MRGPLSQLGEPAMAGTRGPTRSPFRHIAAGPGTSTRAHLRCRLLRCCRAVVSDPLPRLSRIAGFDRAQRSPAVERIRMVRTIHGTGGCHMQYHDAGLGAAASF